MRATRRTRATSKTTQEEHFENHMVGRDGKTSLMDFPKSRSSQSETLVFLPSFPRHCRSRMHHQLAANFALSILSTMTTIVCDFLGLTFPSRRTMGLREKNISWNIFQRCLPREYELPVNTNLSKLSSDSICLPSIVILVTQKAH